MLFGMPTLIELQNLEETMELCRELGFSFVELNMNLPMYQAESLENANYFWKWKEKYQLGYTIHLDENLNVCDFNSEVAAAYRNTVRRTIRVAKILDVPVLNMHMNHGVHFTLPDRKVDLFDVYQDKYLQTFREFRQMCEEEIEDADIKICIENTDGFRPYEKKAIEDLLESPVFGLTWDIGHSNAIGNTDEPFLMQHEDKLTHFHMHDGLLEKNHMALGTGEIDLRQRFELAQKHHCRCVIETKTVDSLRESAAWIRECL